MLRFALQQALPFFIYLKKSLPNAVLLAALAVPDAAFAKAAAKDCFSDVQAAYALLIRQQSTAKNAPININTASQSQLVQLTGVGHNTAAAIIAYREQHGGFSSVDELSKVRGVGAATINKNRHRLTVADKLTVSDK